MLTNNLLLVKVKERQPATKEKTHRIHIENLNLKKLKELEGKEEYRIEISNRFAGLDKLDGELDINKDWETIIENIRISPKESLCY
jgi:hypothetical protein